MNKANLFRDTVKLIVGCEMQNYAPYMIRKTTDLVIVVCGEGQVGATVYVAFPKADFYGEYDSYMDLLTDLEYEFNEYSPRGSWSKFYRTNKMHELEESWVNAPCYHKGWKKMDGNDSLALQAIGLRHDFQDVFTFYGWADDSGENRVLFGVDKINEFIEFDWPAGMPGDWSNTIEKEEHRTKKYYVPTGAQRFKMSATINWQAQTEKYGSVQKIKKF